MSKGGRWIVVPRFQPDYARMQELRYIDRWGCETSHNRPCRTPLCNRLPWYLALGPILPTLTTQHCMRSARGRMHAYRRSSMTIHNSNGGNSHYELASNNNSGQER